MKWRIGTRILSFLGGWGLATFASHAQEPTPRPAIDELKVMTWNIWHGGREDGEKIGPRRVIEVIRESGADLVAMQETYGSGELISQGLGFHFQPRGTNVSIHSRYPIVEDISVFQEFKCVGGLVELPGGHRVAFYGIWLPYGADIWLPRSRDELSEAELRAACRPSANDLKAIYRAIEERLQGDAYRGVSLIVAGDFNSMSHLDYADVAVDQHGRSVNWDTSHVLIDQGMRDAYRETNPVIDRARDATWSPRFEEQEQDRIDYIYYRSAVLRAVDSRVIREHEEKFPSDHAAVLATLRWKEPSAVAAPLALRAVSYNIRRGLGTDDRTDLRRSARVLRELEPDLVGLQEVDLAVKRSGSINQAAELGRELHMHAAFAPFLPLQGGRYGMAVLSKFPIRETRAVVLPTGHEPRVALAVKVILPDERKITVVNVHFDWVEDDRFRFEQARALAAYLEELDEPYVLLGDFNDTPESRTLRLFHERAAEARKPEDQRWTWPAEKPEMEIDFLFAAPRERWNVASARVVDEPLASDHRPVVADLELRATR